MSILRMPAVKLETGHRSHASIYNAIRDGIFTRPVQIGARAVGWPAEEVEATSRSRPCYDPPGCSVPTMYGCLPVSPVARCWGANLWRAFNSVSIYLRACCRRSNPSLHFFSNGYGSCSNMSARVGLALVIATFPSAILVYRRIPGGREAAFGVTGFVGVSVMTSSFFCDRSV